MNIRDYACFLPKTYTPSFYHEGIHYYTAHKYSTEAVFNASRLVNNVMNAISRQCSLAMCRSRLSKAANLTP